jgi:hypothetical protein
MTKRNWFGNYSTHKEVLGHMQELADKTIEHMENVNIQQAIDLKTFLINERLKPLNDWIVGEKEFFYNENKEAYENLKQFQEKAFDLVKEMENKVYDIWKDVQWEYFKQKQQ